jgi:hypothetical protein
MTSPLSRHQREILEWLAGHWELLRWRCGDGTHRWHMGEMEVDGRAVRGLQQRGMVERGGEFDGGQLVLTDLGRQALTAATGRGERIVGGAPGPASDDAAAEGV